MESRIRRIRCGRRGWEQGRQVTWVGRFIAAAIALILVATSVMPMVVEARGDASMTHLHAVSGVGLPDPDHDLGHDDWWAGDLAHHAHAHAQLVAPAAATIMKMRIPPADLRFRIADD